MINFNHTNHTRFLRETSLSRKKARHTANQIAQHQSTTEFTVLEAYLLLSYNTQRRKKNNREETVTSTSLH